MMNRGLGKLALALLCILPEVSSAGVIRGGGRGGAVAPPIPGDSVYLLPDTVVGPVTSANISNAAEYAFTDDGIAFEVHNDWGAACETPLPIPGGTTYPDRTADIFDCYFELADDEFLQWQANLIGLPDVRPADDQYIVAPPPISFEWTLTAGSTTLSWNQNDPQAFLGSRLPYAPAPDIFSGCYAVFRSYNFGDCQEIGLDLSLGTDPLSGADLFALSGGSDLFLSLQVDILAPQGSAFYLVADQEGSTDGSPGQVFGSQTEIFNLTNRMRITQQPDSAVPVPATVFLMMFGLCTLWRPRASRQRRLIFRRSV